MAEDEKAGLDPRYADYPQKFHAFWPRHAIVASGLVVLIISSLAVLTYLIRVPVDFDNAFPDAGMYIPAPEWYFIFLFQPFWYLKGDLKGYLYIGTFVLPFLIFGFLLLVPFIFRRPKSRLKGLLGRFFAVAVPVAVFIAVFAGIYRSSFQAKVQSCIACHTPQYGDRQYLPPMDVAEYYRNQRQVQINVGKYRASKLSEGSTDEFGSSAVRGEVETYKDANWQLRHLYEPTFTW